MNAEASHPLFPPVNVIYAHPYSDRSRANAVLVAAALGVEGVGVRRLYELYPDFAIDVAAEQAALSAAELIVWQHPIYWYSTPALLTLWFEKVLARGWAYGPSGNALRGKRCLWVATTGGDENSYSDEGLHGYEFERFIPVMHQTARFCGMIWEPPLIVHAAHRGDGHLERAAGAYRTRLERAARGVS